jgi:hypothetical protein
MDRLMLFGRTYRDNKIWAGMRARLAISSPISCILRSLVSQMFPKRNLHLSLTYVIIVS